MGKYIIKGIISTALGFVFWKYIDLMTEKKIRESQEDNSQTP